MDLVSHQAIVLEWWTYPKQIVGMQSQILHQSFLPRMTVLLDQSMLPLSVVQVNVSVGKYHGI